MVPRAQLSRPIATARSPAAFVLLAPMAMESTPIAVGLLELFRLPLPPMAMPPPPVAEPWPSTTEFTPLALAPVPIDTVLLPLATLFGPTATAPLDTALALVPMARVSWAMALAPIPIAALLAPEALVVLSPTWKWLARIVVVELVNNASPIVTFAALAMSALPTRKLRIGCLSPPPRRTRSSFFALVSLFAVKVRPELLKSLHSVPPGAFEQVSDCAFAADPPQPSAIEADNRVNRRTPPVRPRLLAFPLLLSSSLTATQAPRASFQIFL